jgi:hypothetical protein
MLISNLQVVYQVPAQVQAGPGVPDPLTDHELTGLIPLSNHFFLLER